MSSRLDEGAGSGGNVGSADARAGEDEDEEKNRSKPGGAGRAFENSERPGDFGDLGALAVLEDKKGAMVGGRREALSSLE